MKKRAPVNHDHQVFDLAIVGTGVSGLIVANQLLKEKRNVLLLKERKFKPSYIRDGYRFVPFSNLSEKFIQTELLKKIPYLSSHREIQKEGKDPGRGVSFQIILPKARIDLFHERSLLRREWKREFPGELKQIEGFYAEIDRIKEILSRIRNKESDNPFFPISHPSLFRRWLSLNSLPKEKIHKWLSSFTSEFKKYVELQMVAQGNLLSDSYPISLVSYLFSCDNREQAEGMDFEKLGQGLIERFTQSGGRVEEIEGLERVEGRREGGFTLILDEEGHAFQSRLLLLNSPFHNLADLFGKKRNPFLRLKKRVQPRYALIPFFLGIREKVIPIGMRNLLISLLHIEKNYEGGNLLFISLSPKGDESQAPEGRRALIAQALIPFERSVKEALSDLREGVLNHLNHLFPFLETHLEFIDSEWAENQMGCWSYPLFLYKANSHYQWREGLVPFRVSKNLYFSGKEALPYLGLEGEILAGRWIGVQITSALS